MKTTAHGNFFDQKIIEQQLIKREIMKRVELIKKVLILLAKLKQLNLNKIRNTKTNNLVAKVESRVALNYLINGDLLECLLKELEDAIKECEGHLNFAEHKACLHLHAQAIELTGRNEVNSVSLRY